MDGPTNGELLDRVFRSAEVKHRLTLFTAAELEALQLTDGERGIRIKCFATSKDRLAKPEEVVRQLVLRKLVSSLGYPLSRIAIEVPVKMGSMYAAKAADIVVYTDDTKTAPYIIVEVKKPARRDGLEQLNSYMNASGVWFGVWTNGSSEVCQLRLEPNLFEELPRLPALGETVDDVKAPIRKDELQPLEDLKQEIQYLEDAVLAQAGVSTFDEVFKLIFAKLFDEFDKGDAQTMEFRTTTAPPADQYKRLNGLFNRACAEWPDIFEPTARLELSPEALVAVASSFQTKRFLDADLDVIDAAFEYLINPEQKGDKGQYFTPRAVVKMCVKMLAPINERLLDPACGPGGFLIHTLNWVTEQHLSIKYKSNLAKHKADYAGSRLFGIDFDNRLMRVAKAMMLIVGDGRSNIYRVSALDPREWAGRSDGLVEAIQDEAFDLIMTNPPFAGSITQPEVLGTYDLAYKGDPSKHKRVNQQTRDLLFLERCMRFLKPGGRMAIVLPQGNLNNTSSEYVRSWLARHGRVLAIIGLHPNTFKPFTGTKTSVVIVRKLAAGEHISGDYPIFMAVNEKPVKDNSGNYVYKKNSDGSYGIGPDAKRVVDHDLDEIADAYGAFADGSTNARWQ